MSADSIAALLPIRYFPRSWANEICAQYMSNVFPELVDMFGSMLLLLRNLRSIERQRSLTSLCVASTANSAKRSKGEFPLESARFRSEPTQMSSITTSSHADLLIVSDMC